MLDKMIKKTTSLKSEAVPLYKSIFLYYMLVSTVLVLSVFAAQAFDPGLLKTLLSEDGPVEWFGFFTLFYGSIMAVYFLYKKLQHSKKIDSTYLVLGGLALALIFAALEEISYGQRIFNFGSGDFFQANNAQKETNLHNMVVGGVKLNKLIFGKILFLAMLTHNVIFPLLVKKYKWAKDLGASVGNFSPLVPQILVLIVVALLADLIDSNRRKEIVEASGCLFYVLAMISSFGYGFGGEKLPNVSKKGITKALKVLYVLIPLSAAITTYIYS